jgi:MFS family permease
VASLPIPARLARPLGYPSVGHLEENSQEVLRRFWLEGAFTSFGLALTEPFYTLYALSLGATNAQIGLVNMLSELSGVGLAMPGAIIADRTGRYKRVAFTALSLKRLMWLVMALSPWLLPLRYAIWPMMFAWVGFMAFGRMGNSGWTALSAELVPQEIRGQYFASRNIVQRVCKLALVPAAGLFVRAIGEPLGYQFIMLLAFGFGIGSIYHFSRLPEHPPTRADAEHFSTRAMLRRLSAYPNFIRYTAAHAVLNFGVTMSGPFTQVYLAQSAGFDVATISFVTSVGVFTAMIGMYFFGRLQDRNGITWIMRFAVGMPLIPVFWLWVHDPWQGFVVEFFAALSWTGYILGSFNLLLAITPEDHRPRYVALHTMVASIVGALGPLLGGWLLDIVGFMPVFSLATIVRAAGMILFLALVREPEHSPVVSPAGGTAVKAATVSGSS